MEEALEAIKEPTPPATPLLLTELQEEEEEGVAMVPGTNARSRTLKEAEVMMDMALQDLA